MKVPVLKLPTSALLPLICIVVALSAPDSASAHVSEQGFVLLLPTKAYILSGCLSVLLSILIVAIIPGRLLTRLFSTLRLPLPRLPDRMSDVVSLASMTLFLSICAIGILGPRDPLINLMPLFIWTGFWVIFFTITGVVGNIWQSLNPWSGLCYLIFGNKAGQALVKLPEWLGIAPAIVVFLLVFAFSIADPAPADPDRLAIVVLLYWVTNFLAMAVFGCHEWMRRGEAFSVLFGQLSRVALFNWGQGLRFGFPGWRLVQGPPMTVSAGVFSLVLLGAGSFDGVKETFWWLALNNINPLEFPGRTAVITSSLVGLVLCVAALVLSFLAVAWLGKTLGNYRVAPENGVGLQAMFCAFAPTVLPIALAFHASHFTVTFLINGQYLLAAIGDPFAVGANYLGLGQARVTTGFLNTQASVRTIWLCQAGMVVFGHILAVIISHHKALRLFGGRRSAALSQIPLGLFMILYTLFGLWLLATPRGI